jgi:mandelate racemase
MGRMPELQAGLPKVSAITVRAVRVPLEEPHQTASGVITESPLVLTDVLTDAGVAGHSLVFTYTPAALKPTADLIKNFEALVTGELLAPAEIEHKLAKRFRLLGPQGLVGMALAAIDMALWDALARLNGMSLTGLLGGAAKPVRAYGAVGYEGPAGSAKTAERWAKRGFTGVKAKIGYATVQEDVTVVRAIRKAVGDAVAVMVDYNQCLKPAEAMERVRHLDDEGVVWIEEPTLAHDHQGHAMIARSARTPIQCGENWWGVVDMQHAIDAGASDYMMPEVMKIGGVTGWMRAAALAQAAGVEMSSHLFPEASVQLLAVTPTCHWLEYVDWADAVLEQPVELKDGHVVVPRAPGIGIRWNEKAVQRYLL